MIAALVAVTAVLVVVAPRLGGSTQAAPEPAGGSAPAAQTSEPEVSSVAAVSDEASPIPVDQAAVDAAAAEKEAADAAAAEQKAAEEKAAAKKKELAAVSYAPPAARQGPRPEESGYDAIAATPTEKAQNIPSYPPDGRTGRRIVYSKALMHVWIVDDNDRVVRHYPVIGRWDRPNKGVYKVYSKSLDTMNTHSKVVFSYMVRFAWGKENRDTSIGFHSIPIHYADVPKYNVKKGDPVSTLAELGLPRAVGGCVRAEDSNARFLYYWSRVGDTVVVLPTAV